MGQQYCRYQTIALAFSLWCNIAWFAGAKSQSRSFQNNSNNKKGLSFQSSHSQQSASESTLVWKEETTFSDHDDNNNRSEIFSQPQEDLLHLPRWEPKSKRRIFWFGAMEDKTYGPRQQRRRRISKRRSKDAIMDQDDVPHSLRMRTWKLNLAWKEGKRNRDSTLVMEFDENGYVRCQHPNRSNHRKENDKDIFDDDVDNDNGPTYVVGTWKLAPSGVVWEIVWDGTVYSFFADLQVNPFGDYPKMFRGLVIRDRSSFLPKRFLRPVVASFSGRGFGKDTADFSYRDRGPPKQ